MLLGNNVVHIGASAFTTRVLVQFFGQVPAKARLTYGANSSQL